ncbi:branched-chain amino acid transporter permease [Streptomyces sp. NPDC001339]|uniref:branched-chain amino acid transporter permease n=1 Tax=Streptomyces sp. NPDC001339 TaxID=3364563 RepID=UPI0036766516
MTGGLYILSAILVITGVTFALRGLLFVALRRVADSDIMRYFGVAMPGGVMLILVFYTVSSTDFSHSPYGLPTLAGIAATSAVYHWRRNPLLAIVVGTGIFLVLNRTLG